MSFRAVLAAAVALVASLAPAACGSESSPSEEHESAASAAVALREAGETQDALTAALKSYRRGDRKAAENQVAEAYVQHFEEVEGALERKDADLKEHLEEAISGDLRDAMKRGRPVAQVRSQVDAVVADLEKAEAALR